MRLSVSLDDRTAATVREVAGGDGKMSSWVAAVVKQHLLEEAAKQIRNYDSTHDDLDWETARLEGRA